MRQVLRKGGFALLAFVWGAVSACTPVHEPLPNAAEARLRAGVLPDAVPPVPPQGALGVAQDHYRAGNFGFAARYFEQAAAVGQGPEAWLGLAAAYDRLRRFDLADRAYAKAQPSVGNTAAYHNNLGFSYLLRGERNLARASFRRAMQLAPDDPTIRNNLLLLEGAAASQSISAILAQS